MRHLLATLLLTALPPLLAQAAEMRSDATDRTAIALTIYNGEMALVRDRRRLTLGQGENRLAFADVSAAIRPETARLYGQVTVREQNFDFDLLSPRKLLEKYVGREVGLVRIHPGTDEERHERGTLLSVADNGVVFRIGERIETGGTNSPWRFVFDRVPDNLRERPTLSMTLDVPKAGGQELELTYLSGAIDWSADYVAALDADETRLSLTGWVTLTNRSGSRYEDATVQLMAGDVHRAEPEYRVRKNVMMAMAEAPADAVREEGLFEYHLYTLARPTTLEENQTKQVQLLQGEAIPLRKSYRIQGSGPWQRNGKEELKARVFLAFDNRAPGLGKPLPRGVMRFFKHDSEGRVQFIGENRIDHTPEGREVRLPVGNAFDVTATREQRDYRKLYGDQQESAWHLELFNAKEQAVTVQVAEPMPGDWQVVEESLPHTRENAQTALWRVDLPAKGKITLDYKVRFK